MNAVLIAQIINAGFAVISGFRRFIGTNAQITARLDRVDMGEAAITVAEVEAQLDSLQDEITRGRGLP